MQISVLDSFGKLVHADSHCDGAKSCTVMTDPQQEYMHVMHLTRVLIPVTRLCHAVCSIRSLLTQNQCILWRALSWQPSASVP